MPYWKFGDKSKIAQYLSVTPQTFNSVINRKHGCSYKNSIRYSNACKRFGYEIPHKDFMNAKTTKHPAFKALK